MLTDHIDIRPMSPGLEQRKQAAQIAGEKGHGVRMEIHSSHTEFYIDRTIPVGQVAVYEPRAYKAWPEYVRTIEADDESWLSPLERRAAGQASSDAGGNRG